MGDKPTNLQLEGLRKRIRNLRVTLHLITKSKRGIIGLIILLSFVFMAVFGPVIVPHELLLTHTQEIYVGVSWKHFLGTDYSGRDVFAQIVYGSRGVLSISFLGGLFVVLIGTVFGLIAGLKGGKTDTVLMFASDVALSIPTFPLLIVITSFIKTRTDIFSFAFLLSITAWAGLARSVRSQVLSLKGREFIESARTLGLGTFHIIFGELLPNVAPFIYISFVYAMLGAMGGALGLFFIGLGALEMDNWGMMLNQALSQGIVFLSKSAAILYFIAPVMAILLLTLSLVFLSSGFEAVFNPRLREE